MRRPFEGGDAAPALLDELGCHGPTHPYELAAAPFPAELREESAADFEEAARLLALLVRKPQHDGGDVLGRESVYDLLWHHRLGEARTGDRRDGVHVHALLLAFDRESVGEPDEAKLRHGVVGLA